MIRIISVSPPLRDATGQNMEVPCLRFFSPPCSVRNGTVQRGGESEVLPGGWRWPVAGWEAARAGGGSALLGGRSHRSLGSGGDHGRLTGAESSGGSCRRPWPRITGTRKNSSRRQGRSSPFAGIYLLLRGSAPSVAFALDPPQLASSPPLGSFPRST